MNTLDDPRDVLTASPTDDRNTFDQPRPETGGQLRGIIIVLGEIPRHPRVMEEIPPTAAQRPSDDRGIHHREVVGADQKRVVALLQQRTVSRPNLRHVLDAVPHQDPQDERDGNDPEGGGQTTHFTLERMGSPGPEWKPCQEATLRKASPQ